MIGDLATKITTRQEEDRVLEAALDILESRSRPGMALDTASRLATYSQVDLGPLNIRLHDHWMISSRGHFSFARIDLL